MTIGSLFSGIGGLELGILAEEPTAEIVWQAECDPYALAVLARHFPNVRRYTDVKEIGHEAPPVDLICGGFPCQDISNAGGRAGIDGKRSGLWSEYVRIVRVLRPSLVFVENVAALTVRGLDRVLGDLASLGFDAEWDVLRAADVGAPHLRARIFILAYTNGIDGWLQPGRRDGARGADSTVVADDGANGAVADTDCGRREGIGIGSVREDRNTHAGSHADGRGCARFMANTPSNGRIEGRTESTWQRWRSDSPVAGIGTAPSGQGEAEPGGLGSSVWPGDHEGWATEPPVGRVAHGVPGRVDRLRCLGNAVVQQQAAFAYRTLKARVLAALAKRTTPTSNPHSTVEAEA